MKNTLKIDYDVDNNYVYIKDELGFIDQKIQVVRGFEFKDETDEEYYKLYRDGVQSLFGSDFYCNSPIMKLYMDEVEASTRIEVNDPFTFKDIKPSEFKREFGVPFTGSTPITYFERKNNPPNRILACCTTIVVDEDELRSMLLMDSPFVYGATKNKLGEYRVRIFVKSDDGSIDPSEDKMIISSRKFQHMGSPNTNEVTRILTNDIGTDIKKVIEKTKEVIKGKK